MAFVVGIFFLCGILSILYLVSKGRSERCECPVATVLTRFPSSLLNGTCCLNFTGSLFNHVPWAAVNYATELKILDLSFCNLTQIDSITVGSTPSSLQELYLGQNQLTTVPHDFLSDAYSLQVLDLGNNLLEDLPADFLQNAKSLRVLLLSGNRLHSLPSSVLRPSLQQLDLEDNPWACTCSLVEELQGAPRRNFSTLEGLVGNLTCVSPQSMTGRSVWSVQAREVCRLPGLTALFIVLPLLLLLGLVLCWCCGKSPLCNLTCNSCNQCGFSFCVHWCLHMHVML
uniref:LRRCT domain-containing protein n=1 Tax=Electrophorus electricus TaxID=8005 RepID=A0A4W4EXD7_ELEEL